MANITSQSLAAAALSYLPATHLPPTPSAAVAHQQADPMFHVRASAPESVAEYIHTPKPPSAWHQVKMDPDDGALVATNSEAHAFSTAHPSTVVPSAATTPPLPDAPELPSLLKYVDNDLLRRRSEWGQPPPGRFLCSVCDRTPHSPTPSTSYLPLTCGCWMHYRCFVAHVTGWANYRQGHEKNCCPNCGTRLFIWEGMVALTLSVRTKIQMANRPFLTDSYYLDGLTGRDVVSDSTEYESDCMHIDRLIDTHFMNLFAPHAPASHYADGSPDLTACYQRILDDLAFYERPKARWLGYSKTNDADGGMGFMLFCMLVAIKFRGYMAEQHARIMTTEAWAIFENGREELQRKIMGEVRGSGWSWGIAPAQPAQLQGWAP